ncbi:ATP-binding protein [Streptacidiphilus cavernicola]|uniref:ATP-binding protein n=1 Tax=Streptacidiphilus cavernicola TaxID=3342716 RepID=A0ABV6VQV9_9ACTN
MHVRGEVPPDPASGTPSPAANPPGASPPAPRAPGAPGTPGAPGAPGILGVEGVWRFAAPAVDSSVPQARHAVRDLLTAQGMAGPQYDDLLQGMLLIVSELVTNAVRHAALLSPQIVVEVVIGSGWVRLSVEDSHPYRPRALHSDEVESGRTGGRGLLLVKAVTTEAGGVYDVERTAGGGKVVWASLPLPVPAPRSEQGN